MKKRRLFFCKNENLDANDDGQKGTRGGGRQTAKMPAEVMMVTQITLWILLGSHHQGRLCPE